MTGETRKVKTKAGRLDIRVTNDPQYLISSLP